MSPRALLLCALLAGCHKDLVEPADDAPPDEAPPAVTLRGAVAKGPLVLGSSVSVAMLGQTLAPTGELFQTATSDDLGAFEVEIAARGFAAIEASGFYYNEVTGALSLAPIQLRALTEVTDEGVQPASINLLTHIGAARAAHTSGMSIAEITANAELALQAVLGVPTAGLDADARGITTDLVQGDVPPSQYLLAVSSVFAQAAVDRGSSVDANLAELINTLAADFADDGQIAAELRAELDAAQSHVDPAQVREALAARLAALGSDAAVPELEHFLDSDLDGFANLHDLCPAVPDPDQADADSDGLGDACDCGSGTPDPGEACDDGNAAYGDGCRPDCSAELCGDGVIDPQEVCDDGPAPGPCADDCARVEACGDGEVDAAEACDDGNNIDGDTCEADCSLPRCGNGIHDVGEVCFGVDVIVPAGGSNGIALGDLNHDGVPDLVTAGTGGVIVHLGAGDATFVAGARVLFGTTAAGVGIADLNGDGDNDVVVADAFTGLLGVMLGDGAGGLGSADVTSSGPASGPSDLDLGDLDGDGRVDVVVSLLNGDAIVVLRGDGRGGLADPMPLDTSPFVLDQPTTVRLGLINPDAALDVVSLTLTNVGITALTLLGDGHGGFSTAGVAAPAQTDSLALGDLDNDGDLDAVASQSGFAAVTLLRNTAGNLRAWDAPLVGPTGPMCQPYGVALTDVNRDGFVDLLAACGGAYPGQAVFVNDGVGGLLPWYLGYGSATSSVAGADLDGDGAGDVVVADPGSVIVGRGEVW